jgi:hypothetical protein
VTNSTREYERRQEQQHNRARYREAARRLFPNVKITEHAHVSTTANDDGAFVECQVWVPKSELGRGKGDKR